MFAVITPLRAARGVTGQTEAFTSRSLSLGSWRLAAVLGGLTFSDNGEWKPSISSGTGGGSQSQVLLPPCNKQKKIPGSKLLSSDSMVTAFRRAAHEVLRPFQALL